jgi:hypothetical protein
MARHSIEALTRRVVRSPPREVFDMMTAHRILDTVGETAGRITMTGLTVIIVALFLVMVLGSKARRGG